MFLGVCSLTFGKSPRTLVPVMVIRVVPSFCSLPGLPYALVVQVLPEGRGRFSSVGMFLSNPELSGKRALSHRRAGRLI